MFSGSRKLVVIALFTVILIALVNLVWWFNYSRTETLLEEQLSHRLASIAHAGGSALSAELIDSLQAGSFEAYAQTLDILEELQSADSLSELFILDEDYHYLATTALEADSTYFLAAINGPYIDSMFFDLNPGVVVTASYPVGGILLKSAFAPLYGREGYLVAVLGVEANVDYFDALADLRGNLYLSTILSVIGGILLGLVFLIYQQRINRAEQQLYLGQTQAYLGRMVAVVAHEVKNPLMIIRGSGERLLKKTGAEEAGFIVEETDRLNEIVSGYLDFVSGNKSLLAGETPADYDLTEMLRGVARQIGEKYGPEPIVWESFNLPESMPVYGFRRSLRQVIFNLLTNAADACREISTEIKIGLEAKVKDGRIRLRISDAGGGIDKKELARIFTPFYTTKRTGSGLGLYLSRKLIEEMGGRLQIRSEPGHGTEVQIELPVRAEKAKKTEKVGE